MRTMLCVPYVDSGGLPGRRVPARAAPLGFSWFPVETIARGLRSRARRASPSARISYSGDLVSKIETGEQAPGPDMARRCDEALGTDGALGRLLVMVRWDAFPGHFRPWLEAEREAHTLRSWELAVVPGLLQTEDYAPRAHWPGARVPRTRLGGVRRPVKGNRLGG